MENTCNGGAASIAQQKQAIQQLLQRLKNNPGPEQRQQLLQFLKASPRIMAAFIKQRQQNLSQQQQQNQQIFVNHNQRSQEHETATGSKMWHQEIRPEMRKYLEEQLFQALNQKLMPDSSLSAARKIEDEMFKKANSRSEYFDMIAEEMHKIQNCS